MRLKKTEVPSQETEINMTPMIDVIFQLVLFFVFSMKFLAFEGQINAFLPKDRGLDASQPDFSRDIRQLTLFLEWSEEGGGTVTLSTMKFYPPGGGEPVDDYRFPMDPGIYRTTDARGQPATITKTKMVRPDGKKGGPVEYNYAAPDFNALETYLADQQRTFAQRSGTGGTLRLTLNFQKKVPWQMVVNVVDICTRVGVTDFALNALELEY